MSDGAFLEALAACTLAFVIAIHARLQETGDVGSWAGLRRTHPDLLDRTFLLRHYGPGELGSHPARRYLALPERTPAL